jgi:hypothetical protein
MSHIPVQYIVPLSIIIAILITKTGNVYLYWSCIAKLREKVKLLLFNYPTQWNRIIKRFVKCLNNEKKI